MTRHAELQAHSSDEAFPRPKGVARSAFGVQSDSRRSTHPIHSFTKLTNREEAGKVFLSEEHAQGQKGRAGPLGQYKLPTALGAQPISPKRTAPQYSFSHVDRLPAGTSCSDTPGPGTYKQPGAFGSQTESLKETGPRCLMGTAGRDKVDKVYMSRKMLTTKLGTQGADPGVYELPEALGKQPSSQKRTGPAFTLPRTSRLKAEYERLTASVPPPGKYETWTSIGQQSLSQCRTAPATGWGKGSSWDAERSRFLSLSHARLLQGTASPDNFDHQNEQNLSAFGKQALSRRPSPPRAAFGASQRFVFKVADTPGPGHYD